MSLALEQTPKHVPAWKKLGLKLKNAKEEAPDLDLLSNGVTNGKKRKNSDRQYVGDSVPAETRSKKSKQAKTNTVQPSVNGSTAVPARPRLKELSPVPTPYTPLTKKKSVSFTPDTKSQDGEGVKELYKTWVAKQIATDPSFDVSTLSPALRSIVPPNITPSIPSDNSSPTPHSTTTATPQKIKSPKKKPKINSKGSKPSQLSPSSDPISDHPSLTYLQTHSTNPQAWKFSKPHQNYLLKHLFSLTHIPSSHNSALLHYLRGLNSTSARSRIRAKALAIRAEDEEWLASEPPESDKMDQETDAECRARRRRDYEAAVARMKEILRAREEEREEREWEANGEKQQWEMRLRKRQRAELVLWSVGERDEITADRTQTEIRDPSRIAIPHVPSTRLKNNTVQTPRGIAELGGISEDGLAKASSGKKINFEIDAAGHHPPLAAATATNGIGEHKDVANGTRAKKPRERKVKKRTTGVPDDESSSDSSSSSSSSSSSDGKGIGTSGEKQTKGNKKGKSNREKTSSSSDSTSDSDSSTTSDSDSDRTTSSSSSDDD